MNNPKSTNLLSTDGWAIYYPEWIDSKESSSYFDLLNKKIAWEHDVIHLFGKKIVTSRQVAWYGDKPFDYSYSKHSRKALPWSGELKELLQKVSDETHTEYNSCLLNLYHNGEEGMGWHSDDEKELLRDGTIASVSFGAERPFSLRIKPQMKK